MKPSMNSSSLKINPPLTPPALNIKDQQPFPCLKQESESENVGQISISDDIESQISKN